eukprot:gene44078-53889_t
MRREIGWRLASAAIYGAPAGIVAWCWQQHGWTLIYRDVHAMPLWYLPLSVLLYLFAQDTWFYWTHRWMHWPRPFRLAHAVHHASRPPAAWAAMAFHPIEALTGALDDLDGAHPDQLHLEPHRLAGEGVVEVEQHRAVFAHLHRRTGVAAQPVGRGELHHVAHLVLLVGVAHFIEQLARHPLLHVGVAFAKGLTGRNVKRGARALFQADQALLKLTRDTLKTYQESFALTQRSFDVGVADALALSQARTAVESAQVTLAQYSRLVAQDRNALALLLGRGVPGDLPQGEVLGDDQLAEVPAGLPSELLQRRPDLAQSLEQLHAATAQVGIAEAAFYPSIRLTGSFGYQSKELDSLISAPARLYNIGPSISLPLFEGGRNKANLAGAKAQVDESLATFRGRMLQALREVDDALAELQGRAATVDAQN